MTSLRAPDRAAIETARERIEGVALRSPLVPLPGLPPSAPRIFLKLENLQPIGSFKLRGAANRVGAASSAELARGLLAASAGNWAQGVAWMARARGVPATIVVPDSAPRAKLAAIERLGARAVTVPYERWWQTMLERCHPGLEGLFLHPVCDPEVLAGNATIGLEILEELPDVDTIVAPWGGGGLACGIAAAVRIHRPAVRVFAAEVDTAAHLAASLASGAPSNVGWRPSFVDGIGGKGLLEEMWPLAQELLTGSIPCPVPAIAAALRRIALDAKVVSEGAGAASVAAALAGAAGTGTIACVVSGGNVDATVLATLLRGELPD